jgi:hypothetical protein
LPTYRNLPLRSKFAKGSTGITLSRRAAANVMRFLEKIGQTALTKIKKKVYPKIGQM